MRKPIIFLLIGLAILVGIQDFFKKKAQAESVKPGPYVVLLSLDGFRWNYQEKASTPTLDSIAKFGVHALDLQPSFPSLSLPNQYTIATGLHPGNHSIISNSFYNVKLKEHYSKERNTNISNGEFYKGEPIWVTAEAQKVKTGSFSWLGSDAKIKGYRPTYWKSYNNNTPYTQRVDTIISWLQKPYKQRPKLITWSINEAYKTVNDIPMIDSVIGYFFNRANTLNIKDSINFIVVSSHGTTEIDTQKVVRLNNLINQNWIDTILGESPFLLVYPEKKCTDSILNSLKNTQGLNAWAKNDIPDKFLLKQNNRVPEIVILANSGWGVEYYHRNDKISKGVCGYDNSQTDMNGVFYAIGPSFRQNYNAGQLYNTDIYNLISNILEIKPAPNDGKMERIINTLKDAKKQSSANSLQ